MITIGKISKKQIIIEAAADLFKEKGYNATSIRDLAIKVGLEPSSIYSHIRSKEELLSDICMTCAIKFIEGMDEIFKSDVSANTKLKALIILHLRMAYEHPATVTVFNDEWKFLPDIVLDKFLCMRKDYEKKFKTILVDGKNEGKFDFKNVDIIFNIIIKTLSWSYSAVKKQRIDALEIELTHFISKALNH